MRFRRQLFWILIAGFVATYALTDLAAQLMDGPLLPFAVFLLAGAINVVFVRKWAWRWMWRRAFARLTRTFERQDSAAARRLLDRLARETASPQLRASIAIHRAMVPILDERWDEAVTSLGAIERATLMPQQEITLDNARAWALSHAGATDEAVTLARATVERARTNTKLSRTSRGACIGTFGVALVRAGNPEPGLALIREAMAYGGSPRLQATRWFYIGEAERALGRAAAAHEAYATAAKLAPDSRAGRRAAERLTSDPPVPYR